VDCSFRCVCRGLWIVLHTWLTEGPTITIRFETAEGLEEGKTQVKMLSVEVGLVEEVALNTDASGVTATVRLDRQVEPLLREDTQFWVVRARVGASGVSGIGTLLSGAYIELAPGTGDTGTRSYVGLEAPPLTPAGSPGKHLILTSQRAEVSLGDPVLYRGFKVGRVESMDFIPQTEQARYSIFIDAPYDQLIHSGTRFWDASGISVSASAEGFRLKVDSIDTLLLGGVTFGSPPGMERGAEVDAGTEFQLYGSYDDILENPYREGTYYVIQFDQTVAGLVPNAPVTYRGVRIGRVERVLLADVGAPEIGAPEVRVVVPVLVYLQPGLLKLPDEPASVSQLREAIAIGVSNGLRATLKTGNLLTGRKEVALDYYPAASDQAGIAETARFRDYDVIPSVEAGAGRIAVELNALVAKINSLPLEDTVVGLNRTLEKMENALATLDTGVASITGIVNTPSTRQLPAELAGSLRELRTVLESFGSGSDVYTNLNASLANLDRTLENLDQLTRELSERPSSVIFGPANTPDPVPEASR
jgi:paraquat-inducible protein B